MQTTCSLTWYARYGRNGTLSRTWRYHVNLILQFCFFDQTGCHFPDNGRIVLWWNIRARYWLSLPSNRWPNSTVLITGRKWWHGHAWRNINHKWRHPQVCFEQQENWLQDHKRKRIQCTAMGSLKELQSVRPFNLTVCFYLAYCWYAFSVAGLITTQMLIYKIKIRFQLGGGLSLLTICLLWYIWITSVTSRL